MNQVLAELIRWAVAAGAFALGALAVAFVAVKLEDRRSCARKVTRKRP